MIIQALAFYLFAGIAVASGVMVITARNPVHSVLFLILAFFNAAGLFVLMGAEFLAMILVVVYVGAVAVLFLFVVMMLDINFAELRKGFLTYLPIGLADRHRSCWWSWCWSSAPGSISPRRLSRQHWRRRRAPTRSPTPMRWAWCSTPITSICSRSPGIVLLVAMIGAIVLTLRQRTGVRRQSIGKQTDAPARRFRRDQEGAERQRGIAHDHRPCPLPDRGRDPVHAGHLRHLPQPQERHHHPDVGRADAAGGEHQSRRLLDPAATIWWARSSPCSC